MQAPPPPLFPNIRFASTAEELKFLRGLIRAIRATDDLLEDCLARHLGLSAAIDVFLAQVGRMLHAEGAFVQLTGTDGPVFARQTGRMPITVEDAVKQDGPRPLEGGRTMFVKALDLGKLRLGSLGLVVRGDFPDGGAQVQALVDAIGEQLDSTLLGFLAMGEGESPLEKMDQLSARTAFKPHGRFGHYELIEPLGAGGMGQVMAARSVGPSGISRLVALKRVLPDLCADEEVMRQFLDEARVGLMLEHPNLVRFFDVGEVAGAYYLAMELVRGVDLAGLIERVGPVEPSYAVAVTIQALHGLDAAHRLRDEDGTHLNLVHRDLSPSNLMIGFDGRVKVLDFGVAKVKRQRSVTLPGMVKGKAFYMSPEQAVGDPLDARSDLFAMGLVLYEALTGLQAFWREKDLDAMEAILNEDLSPHPAIPGPIWDVIGRSLEKKRENRYQNAAEMGRALESAWPVASDTQLSRFVTLHFPERLRALKRLEPGTSSTAAVEEKVTKEKTLIRQRV
jgi:serine/threonine protein kinase